MLLKMAGLTKVVANGRAALQILNSLVDVAAVYVFMAVLGSAVELELQGNTWFASSRGQSPT